MINFKPIKSSINSFTGIHGSATSDTSWERFHLPDGSSLRITGTENGLTLSEFPQREFDEVTLAEVTNASLNFNNVTPEKVTTVAIREGTNVDINNSTVEITALDCSNRENMPELTGVNNSTVKVLSTKYALSDKANMLTAQLGLKKSRGQISQGQYEQEYKQALKADNYLGNIRRDDTSNIDLGYVDLGSVDIYE